MPNNLLLAIGSQPTPASVLSPTESPTWDVSSTGLIDVAVPILLGRLGEKGKGALALQRFCGHVWYPRKHQADQFDHRSTQYTLQVEMQDTVECCPLGKKRRIALS